MDNPGLVFLAAMVAKGSWWADCSVRAVTSLITLMRRFAIGVGLAGLWLATPYTWNNGQAGNTGTNTAAECRDSPSATHDWIADHALDLLPDNEKAWLEPHRAIYLIGTEAPDNRTIRLACGVPHRGYDDRSLGHSVTWNASATMMTNDRPAVRAQEEYAKAVIAFGQGKPAHAAFFLGAMVHYIGDVAQYGHSWPNEKHHSDYETWAAKLTSSFNAGTFEDAIDGDSLVRRTPIYGRATNLPGHVRRQIRRRHSACTHNGRSVLSETRRVHG